MTFSVSRALMYLVLRPVCCVFFCSCIWFFFVAAAIIVSGCGEASGEHGGEGGDADGARGLPGEQDYRRGTTLLVWLFVIVFLFLFLF